jgi:hypothetical protein
MKFISYLYIYFTNTIIVFFCLGDFCWNLNLLFISLSNNLFLETFSLKLTNLNLLLSEKLFFILIK